MSIHMQAAYVPDGATVRIRRRRTLLTGTFTRPTLTIATTQGVVPVSRVDLLEVLRFPHKPTPTP